jgi:hypothetical protein
MLFARSERRAASEIVAFRLLLAKQIVRIAPTSGRHRFSVPWPKIEKSVAEKEKT